MSRDSEVRADLIRRGLVKPRRPARFPLTAEQRVRKHDQVEFLAEQLYNVLANKIVELEPEAKSEMTTWEESEEDGKILFRAQAEYVLSTYNENEKLKKRVAELEER